MKKLFYIHIYSLLALILFSACAKMGSPDGGWYDETPPKVIGASPADQATNVKTKNIKIYFDEFIKIEDAQNKVVVSPPQLEAAEIVGKGKYIDIKLLDSLKENTTYTIDFSDAISDNNEGNPLGNYTYSFSTGETIDTMEVSGYVLESENLEPIKGILVGLYKNLSDTVFCKEPMLRVSRTDSRGHFVIKGIAPGSYRIYALQDADGDYVFNQKSEKIAFSHDLIVPSSRPDIRQDTTWIDSLHIKSIEQVPYTHFLPDEIVLRAFTETLTDRAFIKSERKDADHFTLYFTYGNDKLPEIKGLNFDATNAFVVESSEKRDTVTYWLKDTALVNQDTLRFDMTYLKTDSMGVLQNSTESLEVLSKDTYAKRMKRLEKEQEKWEKAQKKAKEKGEPYDSIRKPEPLIFNISAPSMLDPDKNIIFEFVKPLAKVDVSKIHLYARHDTLWYRSPFAFDKLENRRYQLRGEWRPDIEYSLEIDSAAFQDIYGLTSIAQKKGFKVKSNDSYSSLFVNISKYNGKQIIVQLLDGSDKVVKEVITNNGLAEFYYINPGTYYMRMIVDSNQNGKWDTGDYGKDLQPEAVYYYPESIECREKWDVNENWDPEERPLYLQKPSKVTKQKPDKEKKIKNQNAQRASKLGIQYIAK